MPITSTILVNQLTDPTMLLGSGTLAAPFTTVGTTYGGWQPGVKIVFQLSTQCQAVMKLSGRNSALVSAQAGPYVESNLSHPDAGALICYQRGDFWSERVVDAALLGSGWTLQLFVDPNNNDDTLYLEYLYFRPLPKYFWNHASGQTMELPI